MEMLIASTMPGCRKAPLRMGLPTGVRFAQRARDFNDTACTSAKIAVVEPVPSARVSKR
jgi:hypothetical protein